MMIDTHLFKVLPIYAFIIDKSSYIENEVNYIYQYDYYILLYIACVFSAKNLQHNPLNDRKRIIQLFHYFLNVKVSVESVILVCTGFCKFSIKIDSNIVL